MTEAEELELLELEAEAAAAGQSQTSTAPEPVEDNKFDKQAALQGFASAATLGYQPKIEAALAPAADWLIEKAASTDIGSRALGLPKNFKIEDSGDYEQRLAEAKRVDQELSQQSPKSYGAGAVGGIVSTIPLATAAATKAGLAGATTALGKIGQAGAVGATLGAAQEAGGEFGSQENLMNRLKAAGVGGALGAGGQAIASGAQKLPEAFSKLKTLTGLKVAGANTPQIKRLLKEKGAEKLVKFMDEKGLIKVGQGVDDVYEQSAVLANETGEKIGNIYDDLVNLRQTSEAAPEAVEDFIRTKQAITPSQIVKDATEIAEKELKGVSGGQQAISTIKNELENIAAIGDEAGIKDLLKYRASLDDAIKYNKTYGESPTSKQALMRLRSLVQGRVDDHISALEKAAGKENATIVKELKSLKDTYGKSLKVKDIAENATAREMAKMPVGLPEIGIGTGYGIMTEDPLKGLAAMGAARGARYLGAPALYKALSVGEKTTRALTSPATQITAPMAGQLSRAPWLFMNREEK